MATNTAAANGNLSDSGTWSLGHMPTDGEDVVINNGVVVTWDVGAGSRLPASGTLASISSPGTGSLEITPDTTGPVSIYCTTYTPYNGYLIHLKGTSTNVVTLNGTTMYGSFYITRGALYQDSNTYAVVNVTNILPSTSTYYDSFAILCQAGHLTVNNCTVRGGDSSSSPGIACNTYAPIFNNVNLVAGTKGLAYRGMTPIWNITDKANYISFPTVNADGRGSQRMRFALCPLADEVKDGVKGQFEDGADPPSYSQEGTLVAGGAALSRVRLGM